MATVRVDPLTGDPVVISEHRIPAPPAFGPGHLPEVAVCPFCAGREDLTGPTIAARPGSGPWLARAFPNRRPALRPEEPHHGLDDGGAWGHTAVGAHEVIAEGPDHTGPEPTGAAARAAMHLAADRMEDLRKDTRFRAIGWYRNRGIEAGASQPHPHAQVVAVPVVPGRIARMAESQRARPGLLQARIDAASRAGRVVIEQGGVVAFTPWAPSAPFEVWFAPTDPAPRLAADRARLDGLADVLGGVAARLHAAFGYCAYNAAVYEAPNESPEQDTSWHLRLVPRLVPLAGFEVWSGGAMHPIEPIRAAAVLRGLVP